MPGSKTSSSSARPPAAKAGRGRRTLYTVLVFLFCVFVMDSLVGEKGLLALMRTRQDYARLVERNLRTKAENTRMRGMKDRLLTDPATIEERARGDLGMIKPGEKVFIVRDVRAAKKAN